MRSSHPRPPGCMPIMKLLQIAVHTTLALPRRGFSVSRIPYLSLKHSMTELQSLIFIKHIHWRANFSIFLPNLYYLCALKTKNKIFLEVFNRNIILLSTLLIIPNIGAKAQSYSDTLSVAVYFPCGSSNIAAYPNNLRSLGQFINRIDSAGDIYNITPLGLSITSSTSPEGGITTNRQLSHRRGQSVLDYLNSNSSSFRAIASSAKLVPFLATLREISRDSRDSCSFQFFCCFCGILRGGGAAGAGCGYLSGAWGAAGWLGRTKARPYDVGKRAAQGGTTKVF